MTFLTRNFDPLTPLAPKFPNFAIQILLFSLETHCCRRHTCTCATTFLHHLGTGCCLPKTTYRTKIGGGLGQGSIPKNLGPPTYFCNRWIKLATSNLVHKLGLGLAYQKRRLRPKLAGIWARGASKKVGTPYLFLKPLKLATSNLVYNLGLGSSYQKNNV